MNTLESDFGTIFVGLFVAAVGLLTVAASLFRLRSRDFSILNFGFFCFLVGARRLAEIPSIKVLVGFPFTFPYLNVILTYAEVILLAKLLVQIFGRGLYDSMLWVFRSTIVIAVAVTAYELIRQGPPLEPPVNRVLLFLWFFVWIANVLFIRRQRTAELIVLRISLLAVLVGPVNDNLVNLHLLPWEFSLQLPGFIVLLIGLGYIAAHRFFSNEKKLLMIQHEIEIARRIQQSNLPGDLRPHPGINIVARYVPMSEVAGDFYDFQMKDEASLNVLIADVSGHGVGAALIGSMLKIAFASQVEHLSDPAAVLTEINRILYGKMEGSFVTACSLFIDVANGTLLYANAGHPPPFLLRKSKKEVHRLSGGGTILGPFPGSNYENELLHLSMDDRLVLFTDGIVEARNKAGKFFGDDQFEEFLQQHSDESADRTADQLLERLFEWSGRSNESVSDDDLTFIIIDVASGYDMSGSFVSQKKTDDE